MNAILFDIDGTLLKAHGVGTLAFSQALKDAFNKEFDLSGVDWLGQTDGNVIRMILRKEGLDENEIDKKLPEVFEKYIIYLEKISLEEKERFKLLPNVIELLEVIKDFPIGLVTGNLLRSAFIKLRTVGIDHYFPYGVGGFASDSSDRHRLIEIAADRMIEYYKPEKGFSKLLMIGDSHRDVIASKENNAPIPTVSIAVATGKMPYEVLKTYQPDHCMDDLSDIESIMKIIRSA